MRSVRSLLPTCVVLFSSAVVSVVVAGCSSSDSSAPDTSPDAAVDARRSAPDSGGPDDPDAADSATPKEAGPMGPTVALAPAADQLADALCAFYQRCAPQFISEYAGSLANCKTGASLGVNGGYFPGALFDKAAFDKATACYGALSCDALYGGAYQVACTVPLPVNAGAVGAECNQANDCASSLCTGNTASACGHCAASTVVAVGAPCDATTGTICPNGAYCIDKCIAVVGLGATCDGDGTNTLNATQVCGSGLSCVLGKCAKAAGVGAACTKQSQCDTTKLVTCDQAASQCVAITFLDVDAPCMIFGSTTECGKGLRCVGASGATTGTCKASVPAAGACVRSSDCVFGYNCRTNVCVAAGSDLPVCK